MTAFAKPIKFSWHSYIRGKPTSKVIDNKKLMFVGDKKVNLGFDWANAESSFDDIFELLTIDGIAIAPCLTNQPRCAANFSSCALALVDIDSGMTINELKENAFYLEYAAGFYSTPSHTAENHRFRIIHVLENPITNPEDLRKVYRALMYVYGNADQSCKDAARLFFGTINAAEKEQRNGVLTATAVECLIESQDARDAEEAASYSHTGDNTYRALGDLTKRRIIELLSKCYVGEYCTWRNIGWGLKAGGFSLQDFQYVTTGMMRKKTPADAKKVWDDGSASGQVTMGTVMHFIKQRCGESALVNLPAAKRITNTNKI